MHNKCATFEYIYFANMYGVSVFACVCKANKVKCVSNRIRYAHLYGNMPG